MPRDEAGNPTVLAAAALVESIINDTGPVADEHVGWRATVAVALGNEAIRGHRHGEFAEHMKREG